MSDDSFFREVNEELRQDRVKAVWTRFGLYIIVGVSLVILVTAATLGWQRYTEWRANTSGDRYMSAIALSGEGQTEEALAALETLVEDGYGPYPDLARMSIGGILADGGRTAEAVAAFDAARADGSMPETMRDMAALRAAYLLVDTGDVAAVRERVEPLTGDSDPMRHAAREAIAATAWASGDAATARDLYAELEADGDVPQGIMSRATIVLSLINGAASGTEAGAAAPEPSTAQGEPQGLLTPSEIEDSSAPSTEQSADAASDPSEPAPSGEAPAGTLR